MKIETNHKQEFKPIELKITIESKAELATLFTAVNASWNSLEKSRPMIVDEDEIEYDSIRCLYNEISDIYKKLKNDN